ncbi:MAG TPA: hypothetical protein VF240_10520 [Pyrinomonadaceae bacterium]
MNKCERQWRYICRTLLNVLKFLLYGWVFAWPRFLRLLCQLWLRRCNRRKWRRGQSPIRCMRIPAKVYKRPDPLIYSQKYLKSLGLGVTYNNPDIELFENGLSVNSHALKPDTTYEVRARIWNGSTDAPAVHMPVKFSYLNFGIGQKHVAIGETKVTVPVKGAFGHPATAVVNWKTPAAPGHYCMLVNLIWGDDANPKNNEGQENTDVKKLNSPRATFEFPLRNDTDRAGVFRLAADNYKPPPPPPCKDQPPAKTPEMTQDERNEKLREAIERHGANNFLVPPGWSVEIRPQEVALLPDAEQLITVVVTAPEDDFRGQETFNVHAFDDRNRLVGGVTLTVEG